MACKYTNVEALIELAKAAKEQAYCPYSNFRVGAALVTESDDIYSGCNVENACYPVGTCAERTAICKAVSEGHRKFKAIAVVTDKKKKVTPCGMCRQALREFSSNIIVYCVSSDGSYASQRVSDILPDSFGPEDLTAD